MTGQSSETHAVMVQRRSSSAQGHRAGALQAITPPPGFPGPLMLGRSSPLAIVVPASMMAMTSVPSDMPSPNDGFAAMMISGGPVPVAVKRERVPVVVSSPTPILGPASTSSSTTFSSRKESACASSTDALTVGASGAPAAGATTPNGKGKRASIIRAISEAAATRNSTDGACKAPTSLAIRASLETAASTVAALSVEAALADTVSDAAQVGSSSGGTASSPAAGGGAHAVAMLSSRNRGTSSQHTSSNHGAGGHSSQHQARPAAADVDRSGRTTASMKRSRSMPTLPQQQQQRPRSQSHAAASVSGPTSALQAGGAATVSGSGSMTSRSHSVSFPSTRTASCVPEERKSEEMVPADEQSTSPRSRVSAGAASPSCLSPSKPSQSSTQLAARRSTTTDFSKTYQSPSMTASAAATASGGSTRPAAPPAPGVPQIKKFVVQANAYHCTFVQSMMMSRGPEWKPTLRSAEKLTAADIATCDFVWFKYEFIKGLPHIPRQRLPADVIDKLARRTEEVRAMWNEGTKAWPDHSGDATLAALDLLNAYVMPEEAEEPVSSSPLENVRRKRLPNMILCQGSHAHVVGAVPAGTAPEVGKRFLELRPLLHYHHMKIPKGTPIIGCFKEASAVWRKHMLYRVMKQYCDNKPETRGSVRERMPASFEYDLNSPTAAEDAKEFMTALMSGPEPVVRWLAKATGGANGNGFYVTKDPDDMIRYVGGQTKKAGGETDFWVIQEFVEKMPLLFDGHRFHMKVHVVMVATPVGIDVYAYKKQRIQCCSEVFDPSVMHPLSYIGNWGQQRFATNLVQEKFSTLLEDIKSEYPKLIPAWHRAKQLIAEAVEAAWLCGRQYFVFEPGCYELMGWDFVMEECPDGEWRPLLVEANHRPGFGSERKYMEKLIHEVLELVMYPINGPTKYLQETHNGVVEAIWDHVKTIVIHPFSTSTNPSP